MSPPRGAFEQVSLDLLVAERWQEAQARAETDLQMQPGNPWLQHNLAVACWKLGDLARARSHFDAALRAAPGFPEALANLSVMLSETGFDPAALAICEQAAAAYPDVMHLHSNLGMARLFAGQLDAAEAAFDHALALEPAAPTPRYNRSFVRLLRGELAQGFADYEARFDGSGLWPSGRPSYGLPVWSGQPLRGRRLMIHAEQGFGDTLQFIRYLPMLAAQGPAHLEVHVQPELLPALAALGRHAELRALGSLASPCEFGLPLLSLPHVLGTTQDSVPGLLRYLHADPERVALWRERLGSAKGPRVALVWQGSTTHVRDSERSLDLATLAPLAIEGIEWLSLQKGAAAQAAEGGPLRLRPIGDDLRDFADTAAVLSLVDLVICVDTSVAHLAGALGVPTAVLLSWIPDPRWLLERSDSPWYPSTTLYRQARRGDWSAPVAALAARLAALCQDHAGRQARADQWDAQGVAELAAGRADAAIAPLMQALADCPTHAGAHYHLGRALRALGRALEAECCYRQALALQPDLDEAATSLALLLREAGEHAPSVALLAAVSARQPDSAAAWAMLGNGQLLAGDPSLAIESYQRALTRDSQHAAALAGLRRALQQVGLDIPWAPADAEGLCRLAEQLLDRGCVAAAAGSYQRALALAPRTLRALSGLSDCLLALERWEAVIALTGPARAQFPDQADLHGDYGTAQWKLGARAAARSAFQFALSLVPGHLQAQSHLALLDSEDGAHAQAVSSLARITTDHAEVRETWLNRAAAEEAAARFDAAEASLERALALGPSAAAACNLGILRLLRGAWRSAWPLYEQREDALRLQQQTARQRADVRRWEGDALDGQVLLVRSEQGLGDTLQFLRLIPLLQRFNPARVVLEVQAPLERWLSRLPSREVVVVPRARALPPCDAYVPLLSLPALLELEPAALPPPWLPEGADSVAAAAVRQRLAGRPRPWIGVCWAGNPAHRRDHQRSLPTTCLPDWLANLPGTVVSLQKDPSAAGTAALEAAGALHVDAALADFSDSAALVRSLDLVISVDTALGHLAAGLGVPTWLLLAAVPDWRWLRAGEHSAWYPSARLFRQREAGDWAPVLAAVVQAARTFRSAG